jgi:hypothetical protein
MNEGECSQKDEGCVEYKFKDKLVQDIKTKSKSNTKKHTKPKTTSTTAKDNNEDNNKRDSIVK